MVSKHLLTEMLHQVILGVPKKTQKNHPAPHVSRLVTSWAVNLDIELKRHPPGRCLGFIPFRAPLKNREGTYAFFLAPGTFPGEIHEILKPGKWPR